LFWAATIPALLAVIDSPNRIDIDLTCFAKITVHGNCARSSNMDTLRNQPCIYRHGNFVAGEFDADTWAILGLPATKSNLHAVFPSFATLRRSSQFCCKSSFRFTLLAGLHQPLGNGQ
jgi:hypothetical protein